MNNLIKLIIGFLIFIVPFLLGVLSAELDYRSTMGYFPFKTTKLERWKKKHNLK